jgi:alpha/beta superfamily hydrolase
MHRRLAASLLAVLLVGRQVAAQSTIVDFVVNASDGAKLAATYYSPGKPGPGMLLLHQCNMDRKSWSSLGAALAQRGVHVLTFDYRGYGGSPQPSSAQTQVPDIDAALATLLAQPGVDSSHMALGGASCGVNNAVELARRSNRAKALLLLSGPTNPGGLNYLREHPAIAILGAASSEEDFAVNALRSVVALSKNPATTMKVLSNAGHGAPMFAADSTLLPMVTDWVLRVLH